METSWLFFPWTQGQNPELDEDVTLIRALRDSNAPKFLSFDLPLFSGIISDLYPDAVIPDVDYGKLKTEIENQLRIMNLQAWSLLGCFWDRHIIYMTYI